MLKPVAANRRQRFRVEVSFALSFRIVGRAGVHRGAALDLSPGGMRLSAKNELDIGDQLELGFTLPGSVGDVPVEPPFRSMAIGAVIKRKQAVRNGFVYGVSFQKASPLFLDEIVRYAHLAQLAELRKRSG